METAVQVSAAGGIDAADVKGRIHSLETLGAVDGPGLRFVAFMQGCPMRCEFCHNPDTWDKSAAVQFEWTAAELFQEVCRYRSFIRKGGVTLSGGEPLMQAAFVREFFRMCRDGGIHTALDTSGAIATPEAFAVLDYTDLVLLDVKTADDSLHKCYTGISREHNQRWLDELLARGQKTWIRHVVVPERTFDDARLRGVAELLRGYLSVIERIELLPYHTMGRTKYQKLGIPYPLEGLPDLRQDQIDHARALMRELLPGVEVQ